MSVFLKGSSLLSWWLTTSWGGVNGGVIPLIYRCAVLAFLIPKDSIFSPSSFLSSNLAS